MMLVSSLTILDFCRITYGYDIEDAHIVAVQDCIAISGRVRHSLLSYVFANHVDASILFLSCPGLPFCSFANHVPPRNCPSWSSTANNLYLEGRVDLDSDFKLSSVCRFLMGESFWSFSMSRKFSGWEISRFYWWRTSDSNHACALGNARSF